MLTNTYRTFSLMALVFSKTRNMLKNTITQRIKTSITAATMNSWIYTGDLPPILKIPA